MALWTALEDVLEGAWSLRQLRGREAFEVVKYASLGRGTPMGSGSYAAVPKSVQEVLSRTLVVAGGPGDLGTPNTDHYIYTVTRGRRYVLARTSVGPLAEVLSRPESSGTCRCIRKIFHGLVWDVTTPGPCRCVYYFGVRLFFSPLKGFIPTTPPRTPSFPLQYPPGHVGPVLRPASVAPCVREDRAENPFGLRPVPAGCSGR